MNTIKTIQEVYAEHLKTFSTDILEMVTERFNAQKGLDPVVFALILKEDKIGIAILEGLGKLFVNDEGKEMVAKIIKESAKELKPLAIAFVSEAWVSEKPMTEYQSIVDENGDYREGVIRPSDDPNRREVLMVNFETFDKESICHYDIKREEGNITLKQSTKTEWTPKKPGSTSGRFMNLLEDNWGELARVLKKTMGENLN